MSYTGSEPHQQHNWALLPSTRLNTKLISQIPNLIVFLITVTFNHSSYGAAAYSWLNANFTPWQINAWGSFLITAAVYWAGGLIFMALDMFEPLRVLVAPYKLQPQSKPTWMDYRKVCLIVLRNQVFVALPLTLSIATFAPLRTTAPLPGVLRTLGTFVFCILMMEFSFFHVHRFFHTPRIYKHFHKMHHTQVATLSFFSRIHLTNASFSSFTAPIALASTYCTMTEHFCSNLFPLVVGILLLQAHWSMMIMFFCNLELGTLSTHSGYNFPGSFSALEHDWHHYSFTEMFGPIGLCDEIAGSNKVFKAWLAELGSRNEGGKATTAQAREALAELEVQREE
ncbi:hypothetical protein RQP46_003354 [Phenoliferia psychrophenolica]